MTAHLVYPALPRSLWAQWCRAYDAAYGRIGPKGMVVGHVVACRMACRLVLGIEPQAT